MSSAIYTSRNGRQKSQLVLFAIANLEFWKLTETKMEFGEIRKKFVRQNARKIL
jgi:hypothetical protein